MKDVLISDDFFNNICKSVSSQSQVSCKNKILTSIFLIFEAINDNLPNEIFEKGICNNNKCIVCSSFFANQKKKKYYWLI